MVRKPLFILVLICLTGTPGITSADPSTLSEPAKVCSVRATTYEVLVQRIREKCKPSDIILMWARSPQAMALFCDFEMQIYVDSQNTICSMRKGPYLEREQ